MRDPASPVRVAGKSGISQARTRLGWEPLKRLFESTAKPIATNQTKGAWYRRWRLVTLDGSASSDPDNDTLSYAWSQLSGPAVTLSSTTVPHPTFTPTVVGTYVFQLDVADGHGGTSSDTVQITVQDTTDPLVAVLRPNASAEKIFTGTLYTIEWSASDNGVMSFFDVFYSINGTTGPFNPIAECQGVAGTARSCVWLSPGPATTAGRIRVIAHDSAGRTATDNSNANHSVIRMDEVSCHIRWRCYEFIGYDKRLHPSL